MSESPFRDAHQWVVDLLLSATDGEPPSAIARGRATPSVWPAVPQFLSLSRGAMRRHLLGMTGYDMGVWLGGGA